MEMTTESTGEWNEASEGAAANNADEWREVAAEEQIAIEYEGDGWIGRFMGMDPPNANGIVQTHWTNVTSLEGVDIAERAFLNATRDLINKLKTIPEKALVRAQWTHSMDTGHISGTKMRVFKVQWR